MASPATQEKVALATDDAAAGQVTAATATLEHEEPVETDQSESPVWHSSTDERRPKYWPRSKKWIATLIISAFGFLQPLAETMLAPVERQITEDLDIAQPYQWLLVNSLILIGVGISPLLLAPLSEVYGRKPILLIGSANFTIWLAACGGAQTLGQLLTLRVFSGFGASVADALAGGVLSDLWRPEERGTAFAVFMAAPMLGIAAGPIIGAFISEAVNWRWIFFTIAIASVVCVAAAAIFLYDMYEPRLEHRLRRKARHDAGKVEPPQTSSEQLQTFADLMRNNLQRPLRMLATQLIVQLLAIYMGLMYGICFLFWFIYPRMWTEQYHQSGLFAGVYIAGPLNDWIYVRLKTRNNGVGRPEYRVPTMIIGTVIIPIGLLWWGWSGEAKLHWIMPNIGAFMMGLGMYNCTGCVAVYTIDTYTQYAASAISTNILLRSLTSAFFPLFAPYMFDALGYGLGATVLAAAFAVVGITVVLVLWFFGEAIRARSPYCAAGGDEDK
ncbi:putative mfs multidrug transporter protein [Ilyonectria robusta]